MRKRIAVIVMSLLVLAAIFIGSSQAGENDNENGPAGPLGPAPNSGDGNPDGSGLVPNGQNGEGDSGNGNGPGPAPNSGDGIPDGPGWP